MNTVLLSIILIPIIEIYLFIKIGAQIGAFNTISLIFISAIVGIIYARHEGLNTLRSGFGQLIKNEVPAYEIISGAAITFAAFLLIIPGFATDILGFLIILPFTRKLIFKKLSKSLKRETYEKKSYIDGESEEIKEDDNKKI
tara:strand:+ start:3026 stop:3451 length:426 start_codon:yes stop_codon:yes gene_type:complete